MLKRSIAILLASFVLSPAFANTTVDIATCTDLTGSAFYHGAALLERKDQGWTKDEIKGGRTTFKKQKDGKYDILILDAMKTLYSVRQDGGEVILLRRGKKDATFLHVHPGMVVEIYTLWKDLDGVNRFDLLSSKGGDGMLIHKSSVMVGLCNDINFAVIN
jgi:hypothetical protein